MTNEQLQQKILALEERLVRLESQNQDQIVSYLPKGANYILSKGLGGTKTYYVADSSGGSVNRKLTFKDGILSAET